MTCLERLITFDNQSHCQPQAGKETAKFIYTTSYKYTTTHFTNTHDTIITQLLNQFALLLPSKALDALQEYRYPYGAAVRTQKAQDEETKTWFTADGSAKVQPW